MSLYHEAAELLTAPASAGGSLKSRIFSSKTLKSPPAQIYALVIETCKWSSVLKEVIEKTGFLTLERKLTPVLALLLVHDLLLAKRGIALPATHGLRAGVERHKGRLQSELTKARIARKLPTLDALREYVESGEENGSDELPHPRWARVNSLKSTLEAQLETTFANYDRVASIDAVRQRKGGLRIFLDPNVPNLVAVPQFVDLSKSDAYKSGALIIQDKASCFPACLLDPLPQDGDAIDTCAAPGNKTTHLASILHDHASDHDSNSQKIHAFEKNKVRGETLKKMVTVAGGQDIIEVHSNQDFLKIDPHDPKYANVGALLLDPSCSGSGIVGRDDMPELHLPFTTAASSTPASKPGRKSKAKKAKEEPRKEEKPLKRKRDDAISSSTKTATTEEPLDIIDDDGQITPVTTQKDLQTRLDALASFQLMLLKHAMSFPAARKITYSTCSVHATENEDVVFGALCSDVARQRGWRILRREEQVKGMKEWPVRGDRKACEEEAKGTGEAEEVAEGCIRANKGDEHGTMGFFLAGFVRDQNDEDAGIPVRDVPDKADGPPRKKLAGGANGGPVSKKPAEKDEEREEWSGFEDDEDQ